jgi:HD superfamily phosphohydrolase
MPQVEPLDHPKVFRDPVHDLIVLEKGDEGGLLKRLIDSPEFQRLRRIRQLGLSCLVYPGAEHSRFTHSLGTYYVAKRMMEVLEERCRKRNDFQRKIRRIRKEILVAALLHDIGHGPFSHLLQAVVSARGTAHKHEEWSKKIIKERFSRLLLSNNVDTSVVVDLLDDKSRKHLLAKDMISSQLDADRIDYLLRDCHATGAQYGRFDLEWLLHALRIGEVGRQKEPRLCFHTMKGRDVVSGFILAREAMYVSVYIHKTTRAYEAMLVNIFSLAKCLLQKHGRDILKPIPEPLAKLLIGEELNVEEYLLLDDFVVLSVLKEWARNGGRGLVGQLARKCHNLVHRQLPYRMIELRDSEERRRAVELKTEFRGKGREFSCHYDAFEDLAYHNIFYRKGQDEEEEEHRAIHFVDEDGGRARVAESESDVINAVSGIKTSIHRLYYDKNDSKVVDCLKKGGLLGTPN